MLIPGKYPLRMVSGADFDFTFRYSIDAVPVALEGFTVDFQVKKAPGDEAVLALTLGDGIEIGADSWVTVYAPANLTATIAPGTYMFGLELTSASGKVDRLIVDRLTVDPDVIS